MTPEATTASTTGFRHFHDQLSSLKEQLLAMSAIAEERTELAVEALLARDNDKANLVITGDTDLNQLKTVPGSAFEAVETGAIVK